MRKSYMLPLFILLLLVCLAGCTSHQNESKQTKQHSSLHTFPVTVTDASNQQVIVKEKPKRIVSLVPSNTEILYELGLGKEVVGVSDADDYPKAVQSKTKVGGTEINIEKVVALKPDLVLAQDSLINKQTIDTLKQQGLTVFIVPDAEDFKTVYQSIQLVGKVTGTAHEANQEVATMKSELASIKEKAQQIKQEKTVYVEISPAPDTYVAGKGTFVDEMLTMIHAKNVVTKEGWPKVTEEAAVASNPQVIITTYGDYIDNPVQQVMKRRAWKSVQAVKNKAVIDVDSDLVSRAGPRLVKGVEALAEAIYPEVFTR